MTENLPKIAALVPMRHSSERVPGKNYRELAGKPLYAHIIETLLACPEISEVVVNTDSPIIKEGLSMNYPTVIVIDRPEELRLGMTPMNEILIYDTDKVEADIYLQTHSTNPLLKSSTVSKAIHTFLNNIGEYDSLFGVTRLQTRLYDQMGIAVNHNPQELLRTQDLSPIFEENSCIYIFNKETLHQKGHRLGDSPLMFEIDASEAWDIDDELDFLIAGFLKDLQLKEN
jgi:CMP-N-acetylneuraminic acid synthetase